MMNEKMCSWREVMAVEFVQDFLSVEKEDIQERNFFRVFNQIFSKEEFLRFFKKHYPANSRRKIAAYYNKEHVRGSLDLKDDNAEIMAALWNVPTMRKEFLAMLDGMKNALHCDLEHDMVYLRWKEFSAFHSLDEQEAKGLLLFYMFRCGLIDDNSRYWNLREKLESIAKYLKASKNDVTRMLNVSGKLYRYRCIDDDMDLSNHVYNYFEGLCDNVLSSTYYSLCEEETLPWEFFSSAVREHGEMLKKLLQSKKSVNILLYGAPGTGKTSFARALAKENARNLYSVAQSGFSERNRNADSSIEFRFAALDICNKQIDQQKSMILVDEADDMLEGNSSLLALISGRPGKGDKGQLNNNLDRDGASTIWITNTPAMALDESSRRRFDYSICFEPLNKKQRLAIWKNNVQKLQMESLFSDEFMEQCATRYPVSAGGISMILQNIQEMNVESKDFESTLRKLMTQHCQLMGLRTDAEKAIGPAKDYSLDGLNIKGDIPLDMIVGAVRRFQTEDADAAPDCPRMNLLLSGPPGTGKTEFVKYLGATLDTKVVVLMGSDLLNQYVGGTEQNIKAAFAQAEAEKAILFLDEIDGLVQNRERAHRNWEVTQVNELLHQMENFSGIMVGATNFMQNLDPAVMRRFTFKLGFDYLDNAGKKMFFERMFKTKLSYGELKRLDAIEKLTPGDFRTVRQSLYYLGAGSNDLRLSSLEQESQVKKDRSFEQGTVEKKKIGF